ncbi:MAG: hypothetical protein ACM3NF_01615 [Gemmatimonadota bacterium]
MRRLSDRLATLLLPALAGAMSTVLLAGCATTGTPPAPGGASAAERVQATVPAAISIGRTLHEGDSWKSRFLSTSEMKRTFKANDGTETVRARTVGLELVATQKVVSVAAGTARIEVAEASSRILQEGKFIDAPFRRLGPPNPVFFTLDTRTETADFSEMEKAYADWMAAVKEGPAGEILGRTFRLDAYVAQLKELYAKPFTRLAGRTLSREPKEGGEKEFILPFLGPGVALGPVAVETSSWYEGFEAKGGVHLLRAAGTYAGTVSWTPEEMRDRLDDFGLPAPSSFQPAGEAHGRYTATVDILSGREVRSESQLRYSASASFTGGTISEEIAGKSVHEPAD